VGDKGYWTMYDDWFDQYVYGVIINKSYLPESVLSILSMKPETLPAWDPMREMFR
jgi:bleomycin hydrolase